MSRNVTKENIITARELVEKERKRLLDLPNEPGFTNWLGDREYPLDWMKNLFGDTLKEKDGFTHASGSRFNGADCNVCGKKVEPDEKITNLEFSFCDEYECGINICSHCLKRLSKNLRESNIKVN